MVITDTGTLARAEAGTARAALTFPSVVCLSDGTLLASCHAGSAKDSDDASVELFRSSDKGRTWTASGRPFADMEVGGRRGTFKVCYLTELQQGVLIAGLMWIDRQTYPGKPLFNGETEGCLPMEIMLAESEDGGHSWSPLRAMQVPEEIGPPSLTNPILELDDGTLAMSIETNKHYQDDSKWYQRVVLFHSTDRGQTWGDPITAGQDPSGRIFSWDLRLGVAPDGRIGSFSWTYDSETNEYLNIHRRISSDGGRTWTAPEDLRFPDQASHPAMLPDGRVVLAWVDRFGSRSIKARLANAIDAPFEPGTEVVLYEHETAAATATDDTGALLEEMSVWSFGLPYSEALPDGDVLVLYYAGTENALDVRWARLRIDD